MTVEDFDEELGGALDCEISASGGEGELYEHFRFIVDKGQQLLRVDKYLVTKLEKSSRNRIQQAADAGCILVNGKAVKSNYRVKPLDVIQIVMDRPRYELEIIAEDIPLEIVMRTISSLWSISLPDLWCIPVTETIPGLWSTLWHGISGTIRITM